jgi:hypothetical protein
MVMADSTQIEHCRMWDRVEAGLRSIQTMRGIMDADDADIGLDYMEGAILIRGGVQAGVSFRSMDLFLHNRRFSGGGFRLTRHVSAMS